jgi:hypothetical protein
VNDEMKRLRATKKQKTTASGISTILRVQFFSLASCCIFLSIST